MFMTAVKLDEKQEYNPAEYLYKVWEAKKDPPIYRGCFTFAKLVSFLEERPTSQKERVELFTQLQQATPDAAAETLYIRPDWTVDVTKSTRKPTAQ
jgi:hypothetical protein